MKFSQLFLYTKREFPAEAQIISHKLMIRAGLIKKLTSGIYMTLPLGLRVYKKLEKIIREEMDKAGCQEVFLPVIQPQELWQETGRWDIYGQEMMKMIDRHNRTFGLGPTHEEVICDLVRNELKSYKQLPIILYQIQTKFRDEIRPRFGVMRSREFIMKDAYSFDIDHESCNKSYDKMYRVYKNIFDRCGFEYVIVEADSGNIGGSQSHEFMVVADSGEEEIVYCNKCDYSSNIESAISMPSTIPDYELSDTDLLKEIYTPDKKTIEEVSEFLKLSPELMIKTLIYKTITVDKEDYVMVLIRGDYNVNEIKLKNHLDVIEVQPAENDDVIKLLGCEPGFLGPVGVSNIKIIADDSIKNLKLGATGANKKDYHIIGVNPESDFQWDSILDLKKVKLNDTCPKCNDGTLNIKRGIEVGHIFRLGTKYSDKMNVSFLDQTGKSKPAIMGCYGIGVNRTVAAVIEQNYDDDGIIWPKALAPFDIIIIIMNIKNDDVQKYADTLYRELNTKYDVLFDDRNERPGIKFKDADLIGIPLKIVVSKKTIESGKLECKIRKTGETKYIDAHNFIDYIDEIHSDLF